MIINLFSGATASEAAGQANKTGAGATTSAGAANLPSGSFGEDTTSLKSASDSVQGLTQTALAADPARAARVQSLKQAVSQGQYQIDPDEIAAAIVTAKV